MTNVFKKFGLAAMVAFAVIAMFNVTSHAAPDSAATPANSIISNGVWDGTQATADAPGEMTLQIGSIYSGVHIDSTADIDTLFVDSVFAFSSLESLSTQDSSGVANYDTVYFQYIVQNYGNVASDSFGVLINIVDTTNTTTHFPVTDLDVTDGVTGAANVLSWATGGAADDTIHYGMNLAEGALDTFYIRVVVPSIDSAADQDNIDIAIRIRDQRDVGTHDYWPDTLGGAYHTSARVVVDTFGTYLYTGVVAGIDSCLLDFGDTQFDTMRVTIGGATMRLAKAVTRVNFSGDPKPGDTLTYTIKYDNDGSGATADPAYIVDRLPSGVQLVDTVSLEGGNGSHPTLECLFRGSWISRIPTTNDSLLRVTALRFTVPAGVDANNGDNASYGIADDSTGHGADGDAGMIKFRVRVR